MNRRLAQAAVVLVATGCAHAGAGTHKQTALQCPSAVPTPRPTAGDLERDPLAPPALADISGGVVHQRLALDHTLAIAPPRTGDRATYPGNDAVCAVLASTLLNGQPVGRQSPDTMAAGLARVTLGSVDPQNVNDFVGTTTIYVDGIPGKSAHRPAVAHYTGRLAWVVVLEDVEISGCPSESAGHSTSHVKPEPAHHGYAVFIVDATTGGDALLYTERRNGGCAGGAEGPFLNVPLTAVSLPWTLINEQPDRSRATITFNVTPCDGYNGVITAVRDSPVVRVKVNRPFGPPCGKSRPVEEKLRAETVNTLLPPNLQHAPTGPVIQDAQ
jgi:hypothetical protein